MHQTLIKVVTGITFSLLMLTACEQQDTLPTEVKTNTSTTTSKTTLSPWKNLVNFHTSGRVSRDTTIRITFKNPVTDKEQIGKSTKGIFTLKPTTKGKAVFESTKSIIFVPDEYLLSDQKYAVTLEPNGLKGLSTTDSPYHFSFSTIPLEYELNIGSLQVDPVNPAVMQLEGQALFSDYVEADKVAKLLRATLQDKALKITWQSDKYGKQYRFNIKDLKRETFTTDIHLQWDGKALGIETSGSRNIPLPAINEFKVIDVSRITPDRDKPYIQITLSGMRDNTQNLKGLIRLEPIPDNKHPAPKPVPFKLSTEDNIIKLFPKDGATGKFNIAIEAGLRGDNGTVLGEKLNKTLKLDTLKPGVRFVGKGHILPENKTLEIPFEAANVNAVQVSAFIINPDNISQFLQVNKLSGDQELGRVGRYLWRKTIPLTAANPAQWNRYSFDASELLRSYPGGLFRLELSIDRRFSTYTCPAETPKTKAADKPLKNHEDSNVTEHSGWDGIEQYITEEEESYQDYIKKWENRNKPCTDAYFEFTDENPVTDSKNFIASNIGLLAKQDSHGKLLIIATDLKSAVPLANVELEIQNFQHQPLATAKTDSNGMAEVTLDSTPFLLIAQKGKDKSYLKLNGKTALSISHFDVGGTKFKKGLKGYIYGERGVWRPGDDIYLTFVFQDKDGVIPDNHPVSMQLISPRGRVVQTLTNTSPTGDFYPFHFKTKEKDETGKWLVRAHLGGNTFSKTLTIETVRPNRLKIDLDFEHTQVSNNKEALYGYAPLPKGKLFSQWLHGASASGLKADISVRFREKKTTFERFSDYIFDDPTRTLDSDDKKILEGRLNEQGELTFQKQFTPKSKAPGMLSAWFTSRVFEEGGAFSTSKQFIDYFPYRHYVGIKLPKGDATRHMLLTDQPHSVEIASLDARGNPASLDHVQVTLYKIDWKWWWDKSPESLAAFSHANHSRKLQQGIVQTHNGRGVWKFSIKYPDWGRYLVRACDLDGKHCTGKTVYIDWPGWAGRAQEQGNSAASTLSLFSDKKAYKVGETAIIQLPKASQGRALVSIENGSDILSQRWVEFGGNKTKSHSGKINEGDIKEEEAHTKNKPAPLNRRQKIEIDITKKMAPNVYVNVTLLQPHQNKHNDRPIRLLGIIPLMVSDPATHLKPVIHTANEWKPLSTQTLKISESNGLPMDYTLAVVDEGLLGLTRYKTPNLHQHFYQKEALGIKSWDLFDDVVGAYGGKLERLLALGGGDDVQIDDAANRPKRFPPVVQFLGVFHLEKDKSQTHEVTLPAYIGAVRLMVIAGKDNAFGQADQSVFVRQPLIMQPSLPRVLSVNEEAIIPVTLFATKEDIKDVTLSMSVDGLLEAVDDKTTVQFDKTGDKLGFLRIRARNKTGQSHLHFVAKSTANGIEYKSEADVYLDVRNPNTESHTITSHVIAAGGSGDFRVQAHGINGSNSAVLEVSVAPPLGLEKYLQYLVQYPHGCLEQTTSSAFPQLYLNQLLDTGSKQNKKIEQHVTRAINRIESFQLTDGSLSYWPGANHKNPWSSLYAGHFLIEAKELGYQVPPTLISNWLRHQSGLAQRWLTGDKHYAYVQAYRLYILALAGKPELGAMNRFRENSLKIMKHNPTQNIKAKWLLASAYQLAGQKEAAKLIIQGLIADPNAKTEQHPETFSSHLSDLGLQLNALTTLGKTQDANLFVQAIADELAKDSHNTHGIAWALMAVSRHVGAVKRGKTAKGVNIEYSLNDQPFKKIVSKKAYRTEALGVISGDSIDVSIKNNTHSKLYTNIISKGIPAAGQESDVSSGLIVNVTYSKPGESATIDMSAPIKQGQDIEVNISVQNISDQDLDNIALTHVIPSGFEIHNAHYKSNSASDYQDVRDDRIYTYFSLAKGKTKYFTRLVNPAYTGRFYLPAIQANAMYQTSIQGRKKGQWIEIQANHLPTSSSSVLKTEALPQPHNSAKVSVDKSWLYDNPDNDSRSKMYLVKGDTVTVLQEVQAAKGKWTRIRYNGTSTIEKWIQSNNLAVDKLEKKE